jgi:hypothetical protein
MGNFKVILTIPLLLILYGCSSSDSSTPVGGGGTPSGLTISGLFQDVEVKGMGFTTATGSGQTDQYGAYDYVAGEDITFSIGGVTLGTVTGAAGITPYDLGTGDTVANVARFIQSLDADDDPTNGIDLTAAAAALAGTTISSDVFLLPAADFETNTEILAAIATAGKLSLINAGTALANLAAGTDSTFDPGELDGKVFVLIDHVSNAAGLLVFDGPTLFSILSTDTTAAGEDGIGGDDNWSIDGAGVLLLEDIAGGSSTIINRIGSSSEMISVTVSEDGAPLLPATFVFPEAVSNADLGGNGSTITSKTYDVVDQDGALISVTFSYDGVSPNGTYIVSDTGETGTYYANAPVPGVTALVDTFNPADITFFVVMDGDPTVVNETATMLVAAATLVAGDILSPDLVFNKIGLGSVTLRSITP